MLLNLQITKVLLVLGVLVIAGGILLISLSRATLETTMNLDREDKLKIVPVIDEGETIYKLPETKMLPSNIFYRFKSLRNWLWWQFSFGEEEETKILFILADKKIAEAEIMAKNGKNRLAFKAGMEAVDKLKYINEKVTKIEGKDVAKEQLLGRIREASIAYSEIIYRIEIQDNKKTVLLKEINEIKEKTEKNLEN
ncbi:hypothetical protein KKD37_02125 [Patescibacteria group bacterium]|nr:hypothetical protein [Patescibacteria group bacterium]